jgi:hypothetical protein
VDHGTETQAGVRARWYVMVTSVSGDSVFATMGPYPTEAHAEAAAEVGRVAHFRIGVARHGAAPRGHGSRGARPRPAPAQLVLPALQ